MRRFRKILVMAVVAVLGAIGGAIPGPDVEGSSRSRQMDARYAETDPIPDPTWSSLHDMDPLVQDLDGDNRSDCLDTVRPGLVDVIVVWTGTRTWSAVLAEIQTIIGAYSGHVEFEDGRKIAVLYDNDLDTESNRNNFLYQLSAVEDDDLQTNRLLVYPLRAGRPTVYSSGGGGGGGFRKTRVQTQNEGWEQWQWSSRSRTIGHARENSLKTNPGGRKRTGDDGIPSGGNPCGNSLTPETVLLAVIDGGVDQAAIENVLGISFQFALGYTSMTGLYYDPPDLLLEKHGTQTAFLAVNQAMNLHEGYAGAQKSSIASNFGLADIKVTLSPAGKTNETHVLQGIQVLRDYLECYPASRDQWYVNTLLNLGADGVLAHHTIHHDGPSLDANGGSTGPFPGGYPSPVAIALDDLYSELNVETCIAAGNSGGNFGYSGGVQSWARGDFSIVTTAVDDDGSVFDWSSWGLKTGSLPDPSENGHPEIADDGDIDVPLPLGLGYPTLEGTSISNSRVFGGLMFFRYEGVTLAPLCSGGGTPPETVRCFRSFVRGILDFQDPPATGVGPNQWYGYGDGTGKADWSVF